MHEATHAQPGPVADAYVVLDSTGIQTVSCRYVVVLEDTGDVDQIEITLANSKSDTIPVVSHVFDYDVSTGLPPGWTYSRMKSTVTLEVGEIERRNSWFGSVRVKSGGAWSNLYKFAGLMLFC